MICNFNKFLFHGLLLTMRSNGGQDLWYFIAQFVRVVKCSSVDGGRSWSVITFFFLSIFLFQFKLLIDSIVVEGQLSQKLCKVIWGILDRHHVWRSLDPTLDISSDFVKKKSIPPPFFFYFLSPSLLHQQQCRKGSPRFPKVPQGSPRFPKVRQGSARFGKVRQGSARFGKVPQGSARFRKVPQGSARFGKVRQGSARFPRVPQGSQRLPKSVHYFLLFFPF